MYSAVGNRVHFERRTRPRPLMITTLVVRRTCSGMVLRNCVVVTVAWVDSVLKESMLVSIHDGGGSDLNGLLFIFFDVFVVGGIE